MIVFTTYTSYQHLLILLYAVLILSTTTITFTQAGSNDNDVTATTTTTSVLISGDGHLSSKAANSVNVNVNSISSASSDHQIIQQLVRQQRERRLKDTKSGGPNEKLQKSEKATWNIVELKEEEVEMLMEDNLFLPETTITANTLHKEATKLQKSISASDPDELNPDDIQHVVSGDPNAPTNAPTNPPTFNYERSSPSVQPSSESSSEQSSEKAGLDFVVGDVVGQVNPAKLEAAVLLATITTIDGTTPTSEIVGLSEVPSEAPSKAQRPSPGPTMKKSKSKSKSKGGKSDKEKSTKKSSKKSSKSAPVVEVNATTEVLVAAPPNTTKADIEAAIKGEVEQVVKAEQAARRSRARGRRLQMLTRSLIAAKDSVSVPVPADDDDAKDDILFVHATTNVKEEEEEEEEERVLQEQEGVKVETSATVMNCDEIFIPPATIPASADVCYFVAVTIVVGFVIDGGNGGDDVAQQAREYVDTLILDVNQAVVEGTFTKDLGFLTVTEGSSAVTGVPTSPPSPTPSSIPPVSPISPSTTTPSAMPSSEPGPSPTNAPTTNAAPKTNSPTTKAPTTNAPTTKAPTTNAPTTNAPTTNAPTTNTPTTNAPTNARVTYPPTFFPTTFATTESPSESSTFPPTSTFPPSITHVPSSTFAPSLSQEPTELSESSDELK